MIPTLGLVFLCTGRDDSERMGGLGREGGREG